jgi:hypothetical protein
VRERMADALLPDVVDEDGAIDIDSPISLD